MNKTLLAILLALIWVLLVVKDAGSTNIPQNDYSAPYISAINSPSWPETAPRSIYIPSVALCSCVEFTKLITDFKGLVGSAKNWPINSSKPEVGGVVILNESKWGHVAVITRITKTHILVEEANYKPCQRTERELLLSDPDILGFWSPKPFSIPSLASLGNF